MQDTQFFITIVSTLVAIPMVFYAGLLAFWFMGAPPFHKAYKDDTAIPVTTIPIVMAKCPNCGYMSQEFIAFTQKLKHGEFQEE
jgi:hypothetical protein